MNVVKGYSDNRNHPSPPPPITTSICRFYIKGMCRFGNQCRNIHENNLQSHNKWKSPQNLQSYDRRSPGNKAKTYRTSGKFSRPCSSSEGPEGPSHSSVAMTRTRKELDFGPSTSTAEEAVALVQRTQSLEKTCGICFDTILQKSNKKHRTFGILPNCVHCFCFTCLRKWRQSKEFDFEVSKACPECRTSSDYVYPSKFWLETKEEKDTFISKEKSRMQKIDCRYFRKGGGVCPFGNTCLYLHALPSGKVLDVGPPQPRRRRTSNLDHELIHQILFWLNDDLVEEVDFDDDFDPDDLDLSDPFDIDILQYMAVSSRR
ncbi:probable E3 ubiquitin-protein ligase makorin-1 [Cylas formicarius]|uniref:probable E3 ubiquitin-protein ligase makorin-1 n=1 Tax=Cylas formicarius TaxID=197179 RepID=UPI002958324C|nr:probable E3 ubiquitin-protein ligase makorin-1 [Cylas formicarius]